jgi:hypothetical protein
MRDESGVRWPQLPLFGAVGAGRQDDLPAPPDSFAPTPSAFVEQEQEVPGAEPEPAS